MKEPRKFNSKRVVAAYHQGVTDRCEGKPPRPPKKGLARKAYINGYHGR